MRASLLIDAWATDGACLRCASIRIRCPRDRRLRDHAGHRHLFTSDGIKPMMPRQTDAPSAKAAAHAVLLSCGCAGSPSSSLGFCFFFLVRSRTDRLAAAAPASPFCAPGQLPPGPLCCRQPLERIRPCLCPSLHPMMKRWRRAVFESTCDTSRHAACMPCPQTERSLSAPDGACVLTAAARRTGLMHACVRDRCLACRERASEHALPVGLRRCRALRRGRIHPRMPLHTAARVSR